MPCILKKTYIRMSISALLIIDKKPEGWYREGGGGVRSGWGACVHSWRIHVDVWQNQYNIVK